MRADMRQMRSARRGGGAKSGWDVLPNPNTRNLARGNERRHDAKSRGQNPRRSPISERARFDDFSLSADAAVSRRHKRREDRSPPVPLSPQFWGGGEAVSFDRNTHDGLYREYQRPDHPLAARIEDRLIELGDFQHRRFIEDGPLIDPSGALVDDRGRLAQRSVYLDDDSSRWKFLPLPSDRPVRLEDPSEMNPVDNMVSITTGDATRIGVPGPHELRYHEYSKVAAYDEGRGARIYHMEDSPHVIDFSSQRRRLIAASSSSAPVEDVYAVSFRDEIHQKPAVGALGRGSGLRRFRDETLDRDAYNWTDTVDAQAMAHPVAYKVRDQSFSEEDWKRRVISAEEDLPWNSELDRTFKKARWGSPTRRDLEGALEEQRYVEEGAISDYQEMEYFASRGKPSHRDEVLHLGRNSRYIREDLEQMNIPRETRNARAIEMDNEDERWTDQERMEREFVPARRPGRFDHSRLGRLGRKVSGSDVRRRLQDSGRESQQGMRNFAERSLQKIDPPKDSQEFKLQTHKAFLRFSKILNEDSTQRDKYRQEGKAYQGFICYVCGSQSKEFVDVHSLVTHCFHSHKAGLKTEHLGLHKALCVLMGWNWTISPDKLSYKKNPGPMIETLKEDLIIWPPIMIIRILSVMKTTSIKEPDLVTNNALRKILIRMKVDVGKVKITRGKGGDKSTLLVKFMPTLSGLREADELHKVFKERNRGRKELEVAASSSSPLSTKEAEEWLHGYMGTVEDLDRLDSDTKRRCVIKSKKDIEDIADAPIEAGAD